MKEAYFIPPPSRDHLAGTQAPQSLTSPNLRLMVCAR